MDIEDKREENQEPQEDKVKDFIQDTDSVPNSEQFINRDEKSGASYIIMQNGMTVSPEDLNDSQKTELEKIVKSLSVIKNCIQAIVSNDIFTASEYIRIFADNNDTGSLNVIFHFARENAQNLTFGMAMMINGCIAHFSGSETREDAIALLEGRAGGVLS